MGRTVTRIKLTNLGDLAKVREGVLPPDQARSVELQALVDTGATTLAIPEDAARAVGAVELHRRKVRLADGTVDELPVVINFVVEILGRQTTCEAFVLPPGATALVGQIPLEALDLIVDPKSKEIAVNPASPDAPILDLLEAG